MPLLVALGCAVAAAVAVGILLRTPVRLLDLRTRQAELELRVEALDAAHKKAVRRWGIEAKAAAKAAPEPPPEDPLLPFDFDAGDPPQSAPSGVSSLSQVRALLRARNGGKP